MQLNCLLLDTEKAADHWPTHPITYPKSKSPTSYLKYVVDHLVALFDGRQLPLDPVRGIRRRRQDGHGHGNGHGDGRPPVTGRRLCALSHVGRSCGRSAVRVAVVGRASADRIRRTRLRPRETVTSRRRSTAWARKIPVRRYATNA